MTPCTCPSASSARPTRTCGSSASSTPPRVKPISGSALSPTHSSEMARTCATSDHRSSASVTMRNVMPCLPALLSADRTSCQDLPRNCRSGRSTRVSSATWTRCQPSSRRRVRGLLRRREQARHPAAALAQGRERPHGLAPVRFGSDRVAEADRDARVPLVGDERLPVGSPEPGVLRPGGHPRQRAAAALLQHLHGGRLVDRGGRGAPPHPTARRHAEGSPSDDEDHEDRRPQQLVGGEARQPVVDVDVAAEDRDEDAQHRDREAEEHVEACDDDGEPPGQPLAPAEPRIRSRTRTNVMARSTRSWVSPRSGPRGPSSGTK